MRHVLVVEGLAEPAAEVYRIRYRANLLFPAEEVWANSFLRSSLYVDSHGEGQWPMAMRFNDKLEGRL